jgi:hypothetical protein
MLGSSSAEIQTDYLKNRTFLQIVGIYIGIRRRCSILRWEEEEEE